MSPRRGIPDKRRSSRLSRPLIVGAIITVAVIAIIVAADLVIKSQNSGLPPSLGLAASGRTAGNAKAPITFVEYSDFQ